LLIIAEQCLRRNNHVELTEFHVHHYNTEDQTRGERGDGRCPFPWAWSAVQAILQFWRSRGQCSLLCLVLDTEDVS